jgi:predicted alpha/beta hydrolase family esterase
MNPTVLILPGLYDSGPKHWQSVWEEAFPWLHRVEQADWDTPVCADWIERLNDEVEAAGDDIVLVAHSLACTLIGKWAALYPRRIRAALLVAPSDTEADFFPDGTVGFSPMPLSRLPFPSIVVASSNDDYATLQRARFFATAWGSEFIAAGALGHINSTSDLGMWPEGLALLARLTGDERYARAVGGAG